MNGNIKDSKAFYVCVKDGQQTLFDPNGTPVFGLVSVKAISTVGDVNTAEVTLVCKHMSHSDMISEVANRAATELQDKIKDAKAEGRIPDLTGGGIAWGPIFQSTIEKTNKP